MTDILTKLTQIQAEQGDIAFARLSRAEYNALLELPDTVHVMTGEGDEEGPTGTVYQGVRTQVNGRALTIYPAFLSEEVRAAIKGKP